MDKIETEVDVDHMGIPVIYMQEDAVSVPFDQTILENELGKIKVIRRQMVIHASKRSAP